MKRISYMYEHDFNWHYKMLSDDMPSKGLRASMFAFDIYYYVFSSAVVER